MSRRASVFARQNPGKRRVRFPDEVMFDESIKESDGDEIMRMLRRASIDIDLDRINMAGMTALHQAVLDENLVLVRLLIHHGARVDKQDEDSWTPLHAAAANGLHQIAALLLSKGAKRDLRTDEGETALELVDPEDTRMLDLLKQETHHLDMEELQHVDRMYSERRMSGLSINRTKPEPAWFRRESLLGAGDCRNPRSLFGSPSDLRKTSSLFGDHRKPSSDSRKPSSLASGWSDSRKSSSHASESRKPSNYHSDSRKASNLVHDSRKQSNQCSSSAPDARKTSSHVTSTMGENRKASNVLGSPTACKKPSSLVAQSKVSASYKQNLLSPETKRSIHRAPITQVGKVAMMDKDPFSLLRNRKGSMWVGGEGSKLSEEEEEEEESSPRTPRKPESVKEKIVDEEENFAEKIEMWKRKRGGRI